MRYLLSLLTRLGGECRQTILSLFVPYATAAFCHSYMILLYESLALSFLRLLSFFLRYLCGS